MKRKDNFNKNVCWKKATRFSKLSFVGVLTDVLSILLVLSLVSTIDLWDYRKKKTVLTEIAANSDLSMTAGII